MKSIFGICSLILMATILSSCGDSQPLDKAKDEYTVEKYRDAVGELNTITFVSQENTYLSLKDFLEKPDVLGESLPGAIQPVKRFNINPISEERFKDQKYQRLVMRVISGEKAFKVLPEYYAIDQLYMEFHVKSIGEFKELLRENRDSIWNMLISYNTHFVLGEKSTRTEHLTAMDSLGVTARVPLSYVRVNSTPNTIWFREDFKQEIKAAVDEDNPRASAGNVLQIFETTNIILGKTSFIKDSLDIETAQGIISELVFKQFQFEKGGEMTYSFPPLFFVENSNRNIQNYSLDGIWRQPVELLAGPLLARFIVDRNTKQLYFIVAVMRSPSSEYKNLKQKTIIKAEAILSTFSIQ